MNQRVLVLKLFKDTCDWVAVEKDDAKKQIMATVFGKQLCHENTTELEVWKTLV